VDTGGDSRGLTLVACGVVPPATRNEVSPLFPVHPLLLWAALSFRPAGSMLYALFTSVMATVAATDATGRFTGLTRGEVMIKLQGLQRPPGPDRTPPARSAPNNLSAVITEQRNTRQLGGAGLPGTDGGPGAPHG
jgi:hypothetical protein